MPTPGPHTHKHTYVCVYLHSNFQRQVQIYKCKLVYNMQMKFLKVCLRNYALIGDNL